ncbi:UDP-glucose 4-epimerase [Sphingobacteriaceae bacterium]|nr:UDP-glucose 4-epimerase [Sphingobacteriaceae bacterium]
MQNKPTILITGATGFIGQHLVKLSIEKGFAVHALVRKTSDVTFIKNLGANILYADLSSTKSILKVFLELTGLGLTVDYIIHAAALTKARSEKEFFDSNAKSTLHILAAIEQARLKLKKFIFISSLAASGPENFGKLIEKDHDQPITQYGKSKLQAERIVRSFETIPYLILRPTAVYGPGEKDLLSVFKIVNRGINPSLGFNKQQLTFIYVKDLAELILAAVVSEQMNKTYFITDTQIYDKADFATAIARFIDKKVLNVKLPLTLVKGISFFAENISSAFGKQSPLTLEKYKELTAQSWNCNVADTFKELNYTPVYSLEEGIKETARWYKQHNWI